MDGPGPLVLLTKGQDRNPGSRVISTMSFCEHCQGQRFDRARVLRALRQAREELRATRSSGKVDAVLLAAMHAVRALDIPHLGPPEPEEDEVIH